MRRGISHMDKADFADLFVFKADFEYLFSRFFKKYSTSHMDMADFAIWGGYDL